MLLAIAGNSMLQHSNARALNYERSKQMGDIIYKIISGICIMILCALLIGTGIALFHMLIVTFNIAYVIIGTIVVLMIAYVVGNSI